MKWGKVVAETTLTDFNQTRNIEDANETFSTITDEMPEKGGLEPETSNVGSIAVRSAVGDNSMTPKVLTFEGYGIWRIPFMAMTISCAIKFEKSDSPSKIQH
jgi:hypothetical protein